MRERSRPGSFHGDDRGEAPLYDPYLSAEALGRARGAGAGRRGRLWLALAFLLALNTAVGVLVWRLASGRGSDAELGPAADDPVALDDHVYDAPRLPAPADLSEPDPDAERPHPRPLPSSVPQATFIGETGRITVVDLGVSERSLTEALRHQQAEAEKARQKLLVMVTGSSCAPCRGVDGALSDPRMQQALDAVRLVRVDIDVFGEELDQLRVPRDAYPGFFLFDRNLAPSDGIHGGEWDADVAENIAPVLGPFVRGAYRHRRHQWAPRAGGIHL
ncbi:MAG: hypothetical protein HY908_26775 [Myxococcales bacterium]|nr:hypothetical protein [Myxococcales bacterium]